MNFMKKLQFLALSGLLVLNYSCFNRCICLENEIKDKGVSDTSVYHPIDEEEMYYNLNLDSSIVNYAKDSINYDSLEGDFFKETPIKEEYGPEQGW
jgi:hypothetical protein